MSGILYENGSHWVRAASWGYEVYRDAEPDAIRVACISIKGQEGFARAIKEADRHHIASHPSTVCADVTQIPNERQK